MGETIQRLGAIKVDIMYQRQEATGSWFVVKGEGPRLLGSDLLRKYLLDCGEIKLSTIAEDVMTLYTEVFKDEFGLKRWCSC